MHYAPVIDRFPITPALGPASLAIFAGAFVATALAALRRPAFGIAALAFVTPFAFAHAIAGTTLTLPKAVLLGVACALPYRTLGAQLRTAPLRGVLAAFGVLIAAIALTLLAAEHRADTLRETAKWIEYAAFVLVAALGYRADPDAPLVRRAFCASIAIVCASALVQEAIGAPWGIVFGHGVAPRIAGALGGPNQLAGYLEIAAALLAAWNAKTPSRARALLLGVVAVTLLLTFSKAGIAASAVAVAVVAWCERASALRAAAPYLAGAALGLAADGGWILAAKTLPALRATDVHGDYAGGVGHRAELWRAAWFFFSRHPLLGIGAGNYEFELADAGLVGVRTHANSWYLQALAEGGIVLFGATLALIAAIVAALRTRLQRSPWALAAFAATIALVLHQTVDYLVFYPKVAEPWMLLIALGIAA